MKKKILLIFVLVILLFGLTGCRGENSEIDKDVKLFVKDNTLTNKSVTLVLKNDSKNNYSYGESYYIECENNGVFERFDTIHDVVFNLPAYGIESGNSVEIDIDWEYGYGMLESGKYRIVKEIFKSSSSNIDNSIKFNVYAEFEIDENDYVYEKATTTEIELKTEIKFRSSKDNNGQYIDWEDGLIDYNVYIKDSKLYAKNLQTNDERVVFDKESVKNIAIRTICCTGNGYLLILTENGNVYMSDDDSNYFFTFNMKYNKLDAKDIVSFRLIPVADYDIVKNLYGVDSEGREILLHKMN